MHNCSGYKIRHLVWLSLEARPLNRRLGDLGLELLGWGLPDLWLIVCLLLLRSESRKGGRVGLHFAMNRKFYKNSDEILIKFTMIVNFKLNGLKAVDWTLVSIH